MSVLNSTGLTMDRYTEILDSLIAAAEDLWGDSISTDEQELLGHLIRGESLISAETNEIIQELFDMFSIANASGVVLDNLLELLQIYRQSNAKSTATLTLTVDKATTIPAGTSARTAENVYFTTDSDVVFVGAGSDTVAATCTVDGPNNAAIGEINLKASSVNGWVSVTNAAAAIPGRFRQEDADLKSTHAVAVSTSGDRDAASIYEAVAAVSGVSGVSVIDTHPVQVYVIGGSDADVAAAIDGQLTIGIETAGTTPVSVYNDTTKTSKTIKFTRATDLDTYIDMSLTINTSLFPADGDLQIRTAIAALYTGQRIGGAVVYLTLPGAILSVPGVVISSLFLGSSPAPSGTADLTVAADKRAVITSANIGIAHV